MDFSTAEFWYSLVPALLLIWLGNVLLRRNATTRRSYNKWLMLVLSLTLLGLANLQTLIIFLSVTLLSWFLCKWAVSRSLSYKRLMLGLMIFLLLLPLL